MNLQEYLLTCLAEEAAEVAQRATKCLRFGLLDVQVPDEKTYANNEDRLMAEYLDLCCVMEELMEKGFIRKPDDRDVDRHFANKKSRVERYMVLSVKNGCLDVQTSKSENTAYDFHDGRHQ